MTALWIDRTVEPATLAIKVASWAAAALVVLAAPFVNTAAFAQADRLSARNQPYATLGEWLVEYVPADRQRVLPAYCQTSKVFDQGVQLRLVSGSTLYAIDFQGQDYLADNAKTFELEYWFDRPSPNTPSRRIVANLITDGDGFDWIRIEEPNDRPGSADEMMKAQLLSIRSSTRREPWQFQLQGVNRALNALFDCRDEKVLGRPRRAAPVAQPAPQFVPAPQFQSAPPPPPVAQFRAPPPSMSNGDYCNGYATEMVSNTARALQVRCPGWPAGHANHAGHFKWCMTKQRGDVEKARASWSGRLQGCLASQGNRPPAPAPAVAGNASRHPVCSSFAQHAERWDNAAKGQGCRIKNDKTERQYYDWCMGTSDADFRNRSNVAGGHKAGREKECSAQLRRQVRL